eukprot:jgi/Botrbrau1/20620/Bobra.113_1s0045.1
MGQNSLVRGLHDNVDESDAPRGQVTMTASNGGVLLEHHGGSVWGSNAGMLSGYFEEEPLEASGGAANALVAGLADGTTDADMEAEEVQHLDRPSPSASLVDTHTSSDRSRRPRILLAATGSVAAIKVPELARLLLSVGEVRMLATEPARHFFTDHEVPSAARPVHGDEEEWREWRTVGDPVLHIELRRWADMMVIAPLSANTLAKVSQGLCDNLVTCVARAWDFRKPFIVAPAMNTLMWDSVFTARQLAQLTDLGATVVPPVVKTLACGDTGNGAMAAPATVAAAVRDAVPVSLRVG